MNHIPIVPRDNFEPEHPSGGFAVPCCWCKHRHGSDSSEPCRTCDHNACAEKE
jgi:hypothetical protein